MNSTLWKFGIIILLVASSGCSDLLTAPEENENLRPTISIHFSLSEANHVLLYITNYNFELVKVLIDEELPANYYSVNWNAKDSNEDDVASGIYYAYLITGDYFNVIDMILLK
jgi:flagellar hook assembly protein FlgD